jgi:hypothetical protein
MNYVMGKGMPQCHWDRGENGGKFTIIAAVLIKIYIVFGGSKKEKGGNTATRCRYLYSEMTTRRICDDDGGS